MTENGVEVDDQTSSKMIEYENLGLTVVVCCIAGIKSAMLSVGDEIKPEAAGVIGYLQNILKMKVVLLTGDNKDTAKAIARQAGFKTVYAEMLPGDKLTVIRQYKDKGEIVAMVVDGVIVVDMC